MAFGRKSGGKEFDERITPERALVLAEEAAELLVAAEYIEALDLYRRCAHIYHKLSKRQQEAEALIQLARCSEALNDHKEARTYLEEAISLFRTANDRRRLSDTLRLLACASLDRENLTYAARLLKESREICEKEGYLQGYAAALYLMAIPQLIPDRDSAALQALADHAAARTSECIEIAEAAIRLAKAVAQTDNLARTKHLFELSLRQYRGSGYLAALAPAIERIGIPTLLDGRPELFATLADALLALYVAGRHGSGMAAALRELGSHGLRVGATAAGYTFVKESLNRSQSEEMWRDRSAGYIALGCIAWQEEHDDLARSFFDKGFAAAREKVPASELLDRSIRLCRRVLYSEDLKAAALYFARSAAHARSLGEITFYMQAMYYRGWVARRQGDFAAAIRHLEECLIYYGEAGPIRRLGRALTEKGAALFAAGDEIKGRACMTHGLEIARTEADDSGVAAALSALGASQSEGSDGHFERRCLTECLNHGKIERHLHDGALIHLADIERRTGTLGTAGRLYLQAVTLMSHEGRMLAGTQAIEGLATIAAENGRFDISARLLGRSFALRSRTGTAPAGLNAAAIDAATSAARNAITEFETLWNAGSVSSMQDTLKDAWSVTESLAQIH